MSIGLQTGGLGGGLIGAIKDAWAGQLVRRPIHVQTEEPEVEAPKEEKET